MTHTDHDFDDTMRDRFRDAMSELGRARPAARATGQRSRRLPRGLRAGAGVLAVLAVGAVPAYAAGRATAPLPPVHAMMPSPAATASMLASTTAVQNALRAALADREYVKDVTRIEVKLVTYADFEHVWSAGVTGTGACDQGVVDPHTVNGQEYVVAMSGDFLTPSELPHPVQTLPAANPAPATTFDPAAFTTTHWAVLTVLAGGDSEGSPRFEIANVGNSASWPPCFDQLTDVSR